MRPALMQIAPSSEPVRIRYSRLQEPLAMADAGLIPYGMSSIFAWKALPEAAFVKRQILMLIDLNMNPSPDCDFTVAQDRCFLKPRRSGSGKVWNFPDCFLRARESVRRASGFVQTGKPDIIGSEELQQLRVSTLPTSELRGDSTRGSRQLS